ncbi:proline dehydrogenase, partial [Streptomyces sp. NPDC005921]
GRKPDEYEFQMLYGIRSKRPEASANVLGAVTVLRSGIELLADYQRRLAAQDPRPGQGRGKP